MCVCIIDISARVYVMTIHDVIKIEFVCNKFKLHEIDSV